MNECKQCNICEAKSTIEESKDLELVNCHVKYFNDHKFTVWRCKSCASLHSKESVDLAKYYAEYPFKKQTLDFHTRTAYGIRLKLLEKLGVTKDMSILDYGCGAGLYVDFLKSKGFNKVYGFDPFIKSYADQEILKSNFDVVVSHDVIEHVDQPQGFLEAMVKLSKANGLVVIGTPNASEIKLNSKYGPVVELSQPYHRHIFSEQALFKLCSNYNLSPIHIYRRFYFDSLIPGVNVRFMWEYIRRSGGLIDVAVEPFNWKLVLKSPWMIFLAFFGYFWRSPGNILITFRNLNKSMGTGHDSKRFESSKAA